MKYFVSFLFVIFIVGCSSTHLSNGGVTVKLGNELITNKYVYDLATYPQKSNPYLKNTQITNVNIDRTRYENNYFRIWNKIPKENLKCAMWPFDSYKYGKTYGENLHLIDEDFFVFMRKNSNFDAYKSLNKKAVTLNLLNLRAFPTKKPLFRNPGKAGEGFPFDYLQNSTVGANKPVLISHYSKDKEWTYIFTSFTSGWVETNKLVVIAKKYTNKWQKAEQVFLTKDGVPIYDEKGRFLFKSRVGMMLALIGEDKKNYTVLTVSSYKNAQANYHKSKISKNISHKGIMKFNKNNLKSIIDEVAKSKYGWGGEFNERDCSSTLRDIYTPFGLWLPRNSSQQAKVGKIIKLDKFSNDEKLKIIKEKGIPFKTFLHKKGHILMYVGTYNDKVIVFHNIWGIKTKKGQLEGRIIIGKTVYSTLSLGEDQEYYNKEASIINNLDSMNIIFN